MLDLPPLREVIKRHGLSARKSLGQNYILDTALNRRIAVAGGAKDSVVIEIGAGPGGLTRALLYEGAAHIYAIERDRRFLAPLSELAQAADGRLDIIHRDALRVPLSDFAGQGESLRIIANLPFNIAAALLTGWLEEARTVNLAAITILVQEEAAARITARPAAKDYGRLTLFCQWRAESKLLFRVPASCFTPRPQVDARLVQLTPLIRPPYDAPEILLHKIIAAAFGKRRKMLRGALKDLAPRQGLAAWFASAGVLPQARGEDMALADFCSLARTLELLELTENRT